MFKRGSIATNLAAGLTIALVALPLNLALAIACGLPPAAGLITGAIAGALGALLGGSRLQVTGPEVALAPMILLIVNEHGVPGLLIATFLCGLFQITFGLLRLGQLVRLIPLPVIGGFLAAVGLLVFDSQLPRLLGLPSSIGSVHEIRNLGQLAEVHLEVLAVGLVAVAAIFWGPKLLRKVPGPLLGLAVATLIAFALPSVPTVEPFGRGFPHPALPDFGALNFWHLIPEALALALLASIDSLLCAASVDARIGGPSTRNDQELVAQGIANIASACVGGMPVAAAIVRSMAAIEARASTRLAPLTQAICLALVLMLFAPWVTHVPLVALAAILLVVGYKLVDRRLLSRLWLFDRFDLSIVVVTAACILFTDFTRGVVAGSVLSVIRFAFLAGGSLQIRPTMARDGMVLARLEGPLFFGSQSRLQRLFEALPLAPLLILDLKGVTFADSSGAGTLKRLLERGGDPDRSVLIVNIPEHLLWLHAEFTFGSSPRIEVRKDVPRRPHSLERTSPSALQTGKGHPSKSNPYRINESQAPLSATGGE